MEETFAANTAIGDIRVIQRARLSGVAYPLACQGRTAFGAWTGAFCEHVITQNFAFVVRNGA